MPAFDIIGSREKAVAIIEIPEGKKAKAIAAEIMKKHRNVHSVLLKASPRAGVYRTRKLKLIAGSRNTEVLHIEHGLKFLLDPRKVYFSPREGTERQRVAAMIKPGEAVMVFFAGVGPFAIAIAKKAKKVTGIEINPAAVKYFKANVNLNRAENIDIAEGDVKESSRKFRSACDRVVMPLPETAIEYLGDAFRCLKPRGIVHFYCFSKEDELKTRKDRVKRLAAKMKKKATFTGAQKVLPYSPGVWKYRLDFSAENR